MKYMRNPQGIRWENLKERNYWEDISVDDRY
jgi:hypothetical protein